MRSECWIQPFTPRTVVEFHPIDSASLAQERELLWYPALLSPPTPAPPAFPRRGRSALPGRRPYRAHV
ncbi:MAG: hypothetical protein AVDCRST_MAG93-632, partial [uncultured Chloroflexia bacterium]